MAAADYDAQALRNLLEAELELSDLLIQRADRSHGKSRRLLWDQVSELGQVIDGDIERLEHAWFRRG